MNPSEFISLTQEHKSVIEKLSLEINSEEALWVSGFFSGIAFSKSDKNSIKPSNLNSSIAPEITILYGSESGNSESLALKASKIIQNKGFKIKVVNMEDFKSSKLENLSIVIVIVSTWGEGDPPDNVSEFYEEFMNSKVNLSKLSYSVCAMGDTSYEHFCKIGKDFDTKLLELGANCLEKRVDCDVEYEETFENWINKVVDKLPKNQISDNQLFSSLNQPLEVNNYDKKNPYEAKVNDKIILNGTGSEKEIMHLELSLSDSNIKYEPGDSLGIYPKNSDGRITEVLDLVKLDPKLNINGDNIFELIQSNYDISSLSLSIALDYNKTVNNKDLQKLIDQSYKKELKEWIKGRNFIDLLETFPKKSWEAESFIKILKPLKPRLYSISSSQRKHNDEVHLTISAVKYSSHDKMRKGVCSCYILDDVKVGDKLNIYVHPNKNFKLPDDNNSPIIMIGPGTGIAPFRSFIEEFSCRENNPESWLFFGDRNFSYDFLYQLEWIDYIEDKTLTYITTAFSRDQKNKVYVQDKIIERGERFWNWINEKNAYIYVCGDASKMAKDVHKAIVSVISKYGKITNKLAEGFLNDLRKKKRYQRDIY